MQGYHAPRHAGRQLSDEPAAAERPTPRGQTFVVQSDAPLTVQTADAMLGSCMRRLESSGQIRQLKSPELAFLVRLFRWVDPRNITPDGNPYIWPSPRTMMEATGLKRARFYQILARLKDVGAIAPGEVDVDERTLDVYEILLAPAGQAHVGRSGQSETARTFRRKGLPRPATEPTLFTPVGAGASLNSRTSESEKSDLPSTTGARAESEKSDSGSDTGARAQSEISDSLSTTGARAESEKVDPSLSINSTAAAAAEGARAEPDPQLVARLTDRETGFDLAAARELARHENCTLAQIAVANDRTRAEADKRERRGQRFESPMGFKRRAIEQAYSPLPTREQLRRERLPEAAALDEAQTGQEAARIAAAERREIQTLKALPPEQLNELREEAIAAETEPALVTIWRKRKGDPIGSPTLRAAMCRLLGAMAGAAAPAGAFTFPRGPG